MTPKASKNDGELDVEDIAMSKGSDNKPAVRFGHHVNDCVGLFSVGSLMGILVSIILIAVLFFGYLMLNSVQTGKKEI